MAILSILGLLIAAGAALVVQNTLMVRMNETASTTLIILVTNSAVGLGALTTLLLTKSGFAGFIEIIAEFRVWSILPGLLGSFFVFASITGYQRLGAASTIAILIASQLVFGLTADMIKTNSAPQNAPFAIAGAVLLIIGAVLVVFKRI
jgi:transporter family-2 protein